MLSCQTRFCVKLKYLTLKINTKSSTDNDSTIKTDLVTYLTHNLNTHEINFLVKDPKFSLSSGVNERTIANINVSLYRLTNQIR